MTGTKSPEDISTKQQRIAKLAEEHPEWVLTTLAHNIDIAWLHAAFDQTRKDGATGVDGQTKASYQVELQARLHDLLDRFKSGSYRAPPVRRVQIPKGDGRQTRPIGIPTFEDKVLQRAVVMALEPIYEQDFLDCSYGYRPGRSAHQALEAIWKELMDVGGGWVLEVDIASYFDTVNHKHLRSFLDKRVRDGVLRRSIDKWLKAGVMDGGVFQRTESGTPQGGVLSPLLANLYLHEVMDMWFEREVKPRLQGQASLVRYADDMVIVFAREQDARRVMDVLPKRFGKYDLSLHPDKTRLLDFRRPGRKPGSDPDSFDLLGFTHYWGKSRKGRWVVQRKTSKSRFNRALKRIGQWCRHHRHDPVSAQHAKLVSKVRGHYAYFGITGNGRSLATFVHAVERVWRKWLDRRSHKARMTWDRFKLLLKRRPLPPPRVVHSVYRAAKPIC